MIGERCLRPTTSSRATVTSHRRLTEGIRSIWAEAPKIAQAVRPGQFLNVRVSPGPDPVLRRPISVCDVERDSLRLVYRVVGRGTASLARLRVGEELDLLGPLGKPAPLPRDKMTFLCGGGVGVAPLLLLVRHLVAKGNPRIFLGARSRDELILTGDFRRLGVRPSLATDDGSIGFHGPVTEPLTKAVAAAPDPVVFACGPKPMLTRLVKDLDPVPIWGFVEERLGCGTGICYCCALPRKQGGYIRFCEEGPVVKLNDVVL